MHHEFSPSSYPAWTTCPHWESKPADEATDAGTRAHSLLYRAFMGLVNLDDEEAVANEDRDTLRCVRRAKEGITHLIDELFYGEDPDELEYEYRAGSAKLPYSPFGTADVIARCGNHLVVIDYKNRYSDRDYTEQLSAYAQFYCEYEDRVTRITLCVWYGDTGTHTLRETTPEECYKSSLFAISNRISKDSRPRQASAWCTLCAECGACPAAQALVNKAFSIVPKNTSVMINPESIAPMLTICNEVEKRIKAFKAWAKEYAAENGGIVDSEGRMAYILREKKKREIVIGELFNNVKDYVSASELIGACTISQSALKPLLASKGKTNAEIDELISKSSVVTSIEELRKIK